jgi:hypothetical protein
LDIEPGSQQVRIAQAGFESLFSETIEPRRELNRSFRFGVVEFAPEACLLGLCPFEFRGEIAVFERDEAIAGLHLGAVRSIERLDDAARLGSDGDDFLSVHAPNRLLLGTGDEQRACDTTQKSENGYESKGR